MRRSASQSDSIRQPPVRAALCSLPLYFRSLCFLAVAGSRNVRLLCAPLCRSCWAVSARSWAAGRSTLVRMVWLHCTALAGCWFCSNGREEEPLPGAPTRHGRPFLCEALMATRWRWKREEETCSPSWSLFIVSSFDIVLFSPCIPDCSLSKSIFLLHPVFLFLFPFCCNSRLFY